MSYVIEAFIVGQSVDLVADLHGLNVISLPQNFGLVPLNRDLLDGREITLLDAAEQTGAESSFIPETIAALARKLSVMGKIAYIEAEMFGGVGLQASVVWESGRIVAGPMIEERAINHALKMIGVERGNNIDEFAALGLGRYRSTVGWLKHGET